MIQLTIRSLVAADRDPAVNVINAAARWYGDFLPPEDLHDPEMTAAQWEDEARRLAWYGGFVDGVLVGVMGLERARDAALLRHAYILPAHQHHGIGLHENRDTWDEAVAGFAKTMLERDPTLTEDVIRKFGHNMFGGDFVFSVSRDFVRRCPTPLLLQPGSDKPHPAETSAEIARLAPNLEIQKDWRAPTHLAESIQWVADFLGRHTPKMGDAR